MAPPDTMGASEVDLTGLPECNVDSDEEDELCESMEVSTRAKGS